MLDEANELFVKVIPSKNYDFFISKYRRPSWWSMNECKNKVVALRVIGSLKM